jgi:DNA repair exonuclease SbcCD ATPase subunit
MPENPYTEFGDAEFLRYLAQNDYNIDGKYLPEGVNLFAVADRLEAAKIHYTDLSAAFNAVKADYDRLIERLQDAEARIKRMREGFEGCCPACEPVGVKNQELETKLKAYESDRPVFVFGNGEPPQIVFLEEEMKSAAERYKNGQDAMKRLAELDEELGLQ